MSAPLPLAVPAPTMAFKLVAGFYAPLEDTVALAFPPIRFPDGSAMTADDYSGAKALLSRTLTAGSTPDVWDPESKSWKSASAVDLSTLAGIPLVPPKTPADPWLGMLIAAGQKDASGAPLVQEAVGHFPQYRVRGVFRAKRAGVDAFGLGPDGAPIEFA